MSLHNTFVVTEDYLFKHLIFRDEVDIEVVRSNMDYFFHRIPVNIFKEEYLILYSVLKGLHQYKICLTYDYLNQLLTNNIDTFLQDPLIQLGSDTTETLLERREVVMDYLLGTFDLLADSPLETESPLESSTELYIETWAKLEMTRIIQNQLLIVSEGLQVGRKRYYGHEEAKAYYDKAYQIIESVTAGNGDVISASIDTSEMTIEEIDEQMQTENDAPVITTMGVASMDELYDYRKGDIITIQAGTGVGKTRMANNFVYNALALGNNVLYLTFEQKSTRVWAMQQARHILARHGYHASLSDKQILRSTYDTQYDSIVQDSKHDFRNNPNMGRLRIESVNLHATAIENKLTSVWDNGFHFDMVVFDYLGLILTNGMQRYDALTDVVNNLKSNVKSFKGEGFLACILNQLTKESEKAILNGTFESGKNDGSETQYLGRASDYIYTLVQRTEDKLANRMWLYIDKVRLGDIQTPKIPLACHLGHMYFADFNYANASEQAMSVG